MTSEKYKVWSRGLNVEPGSHHELDACTRLETDGVIDIAHEPKFVLPRSAAIFTIGSCFARNIEDALVAEKLRVTSTELQLPREGYQGHKPNSVLTKFNTHSMLTEIQTTFSGAQLPDDGLIELRDGLFWNSQLHRTGLVARDLAVQVKNTVTDTVRKIAESNLVVVTLGLTEYWFDKEFEVPLNDAPVDWRHAKRTNRFEFRNTTFREALAQVEELSETIFRVSSPDARIVFTVSPVPLQRTFSDNDIIVANNYSKSVLRAVAHEIAAQSDRIDYYPSFEIVTNTPRSIAWRHDQRHVEASVVNQVVSKFQKLYFEQA